MTSPDVGRGADRDDDPPLGLPSPRERVALALVIVGAVLLSAAAWWVSPQLGLAVLGATLLGLGVLIGFAS